MVFSEKQKRVLGWWTRGSAERGRDALICDGAVRSGKTLCLGLSFVLWSMARFRGQQFALCGKTRESIRRNLLPGVLPLLGELGFRWEEKVSKGELRIWCGRRENTYYLFGGKDEGSAALIQGITLAGVLLDEVALMPRSFVEQACARCSVAGAKLWFSCNPAGPGHWFYREWICKAEERNALHLRFLMEDNPSLAPETRARYERAFQGAFYRRFVLGEWTAAEGLVYDFFDESMVVPPPEGAAERWIISCVYGTVGKVWAELVPGQRVLLRCERGKATADGSGICPAAPGAGGRTGDRDRGGRPFGGVLFGGAAAGGVEREEGGERRLVRHPADGGRLEEREDHDLYALHGRHSGVWGLLLGPQVRGAGQGEKGLRPRDG